MNAGRRRAKPKCNVRHQTIFTGDNLHVMRGMNSCIIDLIYLDPPFNSNANYGAPIGGKKAQQIFRDIWTLQDVDLAWWSMIRDQNEPLYNYLDAVRGMHSPSMMSYLVYMAVRLQEMKRILKDTGSIYLHCDQHAGHYLKPLMDAIFGRKNFCNEVIWSYQRWTGATKHFQRMHDNLFFYAMSDEAIFNVLKKPYSEKSQHQAARVSKFVEGELRQEYTDNTTREKAMRDVWEISYLNSLSKERKEANYPTQKPLDLVRRVILASSIPGQMVLDPFCGCATTCIAAEMEQRNWCGIDVSEKAAELVEKRLASRLDTYNFTHLVTIPKRDHLGRIPPYNHPKNKTALYARQLGYCFLCYEHFQIRELSIDHIIPRRLNGTDHIGNSQLLCNPCNSEKGGKTYEAAVARRMKIDTGWENSKANVER